MKATISIGIISIFLFYACTNIRQDYSVNEKALLSYYEFMKIQKEDAPALSNINISLNLDSIDTYSRLDGFVKDICSGKIPNVNYDECWDILPFTYNIKDYSLKPNKNKNYNIEIPAYGFACSFCMVEPIRVKNLDIHLMKDHTYKIIDYPEKDSVKYCKIEELTKITNNFLDLNLSQFFNKSNLINDLGKRDSLKYFYMLNDPYQFRISMDTTMKFNNLEPLISEIVSSYNKKVNELIEKNMHKKVVDLTYSDLRILARNVMLRLEITKPLDNIRYVAPVVVDSIDNNL